jgi:hypothetical protein
MTCEAHTGGRLPDFLLIGAQKGGTSFFYRVLCEHPMVQPATEKEVHYFDLNHDRGAGWYRSHFPTPGENNGRRVLTGEGTPYYLYHPACARRAAGTVPEAKLIVLLRNPVDRAYSHYHHRTKKGIETLGFEEALESEADRLAGEEERLLADEGYRSFEHQHFSYLSRGLYAGQLARWHRHFDRDRTLVLRSEDLYETPHAVFAEAQRFLGLPAWRSKSVERAREKRRRRGPRYPPMAIETRRRLVRHFEPHNQRLYEYLGRDLRWE